MATNKGRLYRQDKQLCYVISNSMIIEPNLAYASKPSPFDINNWLMVSNKSNSIANNSNNQLKFSQNKDSMPFGIGVRDCPGKFLAQREIYIFLANLLLNYQIKPVSDEQDINIQFVQGLAKEIEPKIPVRVEKRTRE